MSGKLQFVGKEVRLGKLKLVGYAFDYVPLNTKSLSRSQATFFRFDVTGKNGADFETSPLSPASGTAVALTNACGRGAAK